MTRKAGSTPKIVKIKMPPPKPVATIHPLVTFCVEEWASVWPEMSPLWRNHYEEIALDRDKIQLAPHLEVYHAMASVGGVHVVVARSQGRIIGYHISFVRPHLHYRYSLTAHTDVFWIDPMFRKGMTGIKLFKEAEKTLKARGVQKIFTACKLGLDLGPIFERLGFKEIERHYSKWIGD